MARGEIFYDMHCSPCQLYKISHLRFFTLFPLQVRNDKIYMDFGEYDRVSKIAD